MSSPLLPPNQSTAEAALVESTAPQPPTEPEEITRLYRPQGVQTHVLPWLAWAFDVPLWPRQACEEVRRGIVEASFELHRRAGTLAGVKRLARLVGAEVLRAETPPSKPFSGASLTRDERDAFLARYPELRMYRFRDRAQRMFGRYSKAGFVGHGFRTPSTAAVRYGERAFLVENGVETPLKAMVSEDATISGTAERTAEVRLPGKNHQGAFTGRLGPAYFVPSTARKRLYNAAFKTPYSAQTNALHIRVLTPTAEPIQADYVQVAEQGQARGRIIGHGYYGVGVRVPTTAHLRFYRSIRLWDPDVAVARRQSRRFCGVGRRIPPFTAILATSMPGRRVQIPGRRFSLPAQGTRIYGALPVLRWGARAADAMKLDTKIHRQLVASERHLAGQYVAGQFIKTK